MDKNLNLMTNGIAIWEYKSRIAQGMEGIISCLANNNLLIRFSEKRTQKIVL